MKVNKKYLKTFGIAIAGILIVALTVIALMMVIGPLIGDKFCTLAGCVGGVNIKVIEEIPDRYIVEVDFPSGKRKLTCNSAIPPTPTGGWGGDVCVPDGAFFRQIDVQGTGNLPTSDLPPEDLTVTVTVDGQQITRTFHPEYEIWHPNGEECEPMCYFATIEFDLSK